MKTPCALVARARPHAAAAGVLLLAGAILTGAPAHAQPAPPNGPREVDPRWHALVHGALVPRPGERVEDATIVLRDGVIVSVQPAGAPPDGARVWDCSGLTIYPGLIDAHVPVEAPKPPADKPGAHWNPNVTAQRSALDGPGVDDKARKDLRALGFAAAGVAPKGGVFRGQGAVVLLDDSHAGASSDRADVVAPIAYNEVAFETQRGEYPSAEMGAIALIRQTLLDADWHIESLNVYRRDPAHHEPVPPSDALVALGRNGQSGFPLLFDTTDELQILRAAKIAREFDRRMIALGSGTEFRRLDAITADKTPLIIPLDFPEAPKVATPGDADAVSLVDLMTWEQAPTNPRRLDAAGIPVALTTDKLKKRSDFAANYRKALEAGLPEDRALAMLTTTPARLLGVDDRLGAVRPGMIANLLITDGPLFAEKTKVRDLWIGGERFEITPAPAVQLVGEWKVSFGADQPVDGTITFTERAEGKGPARLGAKVKALDGEAKARSVALRENRITLLVDGEPFRSEGVFALAGAVEGDHIYGRYTQPDGAVLPWTATRAGAPEEKPEPKDAAKRKPDAAPPPEKLPTPFGAFGLMERPAQPHALLISGATIWTSGPAGVIPQGDLLIVDGKVAAVGPTPIDLGANLKVEIIDGAGKHVTPGLIDCHSHTGISGGVNEGTQAVTAEVRIADVIDPDSVAWWRELAGGLTAVNQLHGSANPIGGQNSVVKIRWGCERPDDMRLEGAAPGVKFALGENVKQSNWGERYTTRYPQTRMGVESIMRDRFIAARDYAAEWKRYESLPTPERESTMPPRRDLELDAMAEILAGKRLIHCHSYRQDEILMLCRLAEDFGFRIGTFQHVLEGYKVADAIKKDAIGGSTFSDWWAYKFEVYDAIPENGAIMYEVGVPVSFNSDSDELARRMNYEAAKAVKYGDVPPAEALKFVTLNAAKQLKIDDRVGSLEKGKDGDFVIWSGNPLSAFTRCESTFIDGREYFSLEIDARLREANAAERRRIIQKILSLEKSREGTMARADEDKPDGAPAGARPAGTGAGPGALLEHLRQDALERHNLELLRAGVDPASHRCGECADSDLEH